MSTEPGRAIPYQYVVLRCVPRVHREEFVNIGVILFSPIAGLLRCAWHLDPERLRSLDPDLDLDGLTQAVQAVADVCAGEGDSPNPALPAGRSDLGARFGWLSAPRSTILQPGPVHGGLAADLDLEVSRLLARLVR